MSFIDEFVLRNIQLRDNDHLDAQFKAVEDDDTTNSRMLNLEIPEVTLPPKVPFFHSMVRYIIYSVSCWQAVIASFIITAAVLAVATGMLWNETGQLICNTPTMIIEGFLMAVLIHGQFKSTTKQRSQFRGVLQRRLNIINFLKSSCNDPSALSKSSSSEL